MHSELAERRTSWPMLCRRTDHDRATDPDDSELRQRGQQPGDRSEQGSNRRQHTWKGV
jgi:hypothetical protein